MPVAGGPKITTTGILLEVDAANASSYTSGSSTWVNVFRPGTRNGTINGTLGFTQDDSKGVLTFPGTTSSYVDFGNIGDLSSAWSFQVAVKPAPSASGNYTILSYASGSNTGSWTYKLDYSSSNQSAVLSVYSATGSAQIVHRVTGSVPTGSWSIINASYGNTLVGMYVNGRPTDYVLTTGSTVGYNVNNRLYLGGTFGITSSYYTGSMASFFSYNTDVPNTQLVQNYNAYATRFGLPPSILFPSSVDPDAFRFIEVAQITDQTQINAVNSLTIALKSANLWTRMRAVYPIVGTTAFSQKYNLTDPTISNLRFSGGWDHNRSTGMLPNGINAMAEPSLNISTMGSDLGVGLYVRTVGSGALIGFKNGASFESAPVLVGTSWWLGYASNNYTVPDTRGLYQFQYRPDGSAVGYYQNTLAASTSTSFTSRTSLAFSNGLFGSSWNNQEVSFAFISYGLSNSEILTFNNIVQNYLNSLGRKVL
jgi:hypothetical protein